MQKRRVDMNRSTGNMQQKNIKHHVWATDYSLHNRKKEFKHTKKALNKSLPYDSDVRRSHNTVEIYLHWCCCSCCCYCWNKLTIVAELHIQILVSLCYTANKGPEHKTAIQLCQLLVMSLKTLKKLPSESTPWIQAKLFFLWQIHHVTVKTNQICKDSSSAEAGLSCDPAATVATPAVYCGLLIMWTASHQFQTNCTVAACK